MKRALIHMLIYAVMAVLTVIFCQAQNAAAIFPPLPEALEAMQSDQIVSVEKVTVPAWGNDSRYNYFYSFSPRRGCKKTGFIFYPGAYVDPRSYAPMLHDMAKEGCIAVVFDMYGITRAKDVIEHYPDMESWVIGGHSLGGICASIFIADNLAKHYTDKVVGLVHWAAYGFAATDLSAAPVRAAVIYGDKDGLATPAKIEAGKPYLPAAADYIRISGGNHTQFGYYDTTPDPVQPGDNEADISRKRQERQIVNATLKVLRRDP